jgi:hypothetical protein
MRTRILFLMLVAFALTALATPVFAQCPCCRHAAQGPPSGKGMPNYDSSAEVTLKGTVEAVELQDSSMGWQGLHLKLKTESGVVEVHMGPSWFAQEKGFEFAKGDAIEVLGSRQTLGGVDSLLAREITRGDKTLILRDARGIPAWSGGRRRAPTQ